MHASGCQDENILVLMVRSRSDARKFLFSLLSRGCPYDSFAGPTAPFRLINGTLIETSY